ncbi:uncharacterized protein NEMAJ01_1624 [Nematocida major]|uniref:uncharacterized protein n=1 Tax=Nematocida major TaxID=1912982 RepID=UPI002008DD9D|nr:uncharacterized protein NEMAJ01_1624 [Nematocida major]KAH9386728.1 hypothetical protein NEMAJ01_1624 [Nematocida major]
MAGAFDAQFGKSIANDSLCDRRYCISRILCCFKRAERILPCPESEAPKSVEVRLAFSDLLAEQVDFIRSTVNGISETLRLDIHVLPDLVQHSTHIIANTDPKGLSKRTYKYLAGILLKKPIISFMWYVELFEASRGICAPDYDTLHAEVLLQQLTENNIVRGDFSYGYSDAPAMAHKIVHAEPVLKGVGIQDVNSTLTQAELMLVELAGGTVCKGDGDTSANTVSILDIEQFYAMISSGHVLTLREKKIFRFELPQ